MHPAFAPLRTVLLLASLSSAAAPLLRADGPGSPTAIDLSQLESSGTGQLTTRWTHEDLDLNLDYQLAPGEHAAVYLEGRYRVPLAAWGDNAFPFSAAAKSPGLWQHLHILFHAPRFNPAGQKTVDARIESAQLNDFDVVIEEKLSAASADAPLTGEAAAGPLIFTSDQTLQLRNLLVRRLAAGKQIKLENVRFELFPGKFPSDQALHGLSPQHQGPETDLPTDWPTDFAARFTGQLTLPLASTYRFAPEGNGLAQVYVDGAHLLAPVALSAGEHTLQVTYIHQKEGRPNLSVEVQSGSLATKTLYFGGAKPKANPARHEDKPIPQLATNRILVQRAFVPFPGGKRLETISVGTPQHLNYTYDVDRGTLLRVWRGGFLDMYDMWHERGEPQIIHPLGAAVTLDGEAAFGETLQPGGYDLEPNGQPTFTAHYHGRTVTDRIAPNAAGTGLTRTLTISAGPEPVTITLARGGAVTLLSQDHYTVNDRSYFLDWHEQGAEARPEITGGAGTPALVVTLPGSNQRQQISYDLHW